ncbi:SH3 domain-containing protein [Azospirillum sp. SYSU D00513]|uniref:SH3 domain-containing protein n=1 Tax=Azospirillum sp. SYSU D00513 TaxID=2812561 RepID=UPI001FFF1BAA|nr:SH3 domain-containing protein [Azospirillum sp. SYSU D00513]
MSKAITGIRGLGAVLCGCAMLALAPPAGAETGDVYSVSGERVNLRSGPSDSASIRSTVERGTDLIELKRDGQWIGVRVERTGEEGWVFSDLVRRVEASNLGGGVGAFARISPQFDGLLDEIGREVGYSIIDRVVSAEGDRLRVRPTADWMDKASSDTKMMTALAIYQMWKNHNNGRPVDVDLVDRRGTSLIGIADGADGPELALDRSLATR